MLDKLKKIQDKFNKLEIALSDLDLLKDIKKYTKIQKEYSSLKEIIDVYNLYKQNLKEIDDAKEILKNENDKEIIELSKEELGLLEINKTKIEERLKELLSPKDPNDDKNTIIEIRAGTGGDEASLFCSDLYRMYFRYCQMKSWKVEVLSSSENGINGFKEVVFAVSGSGAFGSLKFESGGHRVQRIPDTESSGRIHTSACTVAVLKEAEDVEVKLKDNEIRIDIMKSSGPGGQSVNTTDSAVRITHLPTGIVVVCQDEKSQHKNKAKALKILKARILELEEKKATQERSDIRKSQIGSGDRSQRIRTYNFPQNRLTDHRINLTLYSLQEIMMGNLDELIKALKMQEREELMELD